MRDEKNIVKKLKALNSMIEDYLDSMDMAEAEAEEEKKAEPKKEK